MGLAGGMLAGRWWKNEFEIKIHRWSEALVGIKVTTGRQPVVERSCLSFVGWRSGQVKLGREVGG